MNTDRAVSNIVLVLKEDGSTTAVELQASGEGEIEEFRPPHDGTG